MFLKAFYVVAIISFVFCFLCVMFNLDYEEYNLMVVLDRISSLEFPDIFNIFEELKDIFNNLTDDIALNWPEWLVPVGNILAALSSPIQLIGLIFKYFVEICLFIINFVIALIPIRW